MYYATEGATLGGNCWVHSRAVRTLSSACQYFLDGALLGFFSYHASRRDAVSWRFHGGFTLATVSLTLHRTFVPLLPVRAAIIALYAASVSHVPHILIDSRHEPVDSQHFGNRQGWGTERRGFLRVGQRSFLPSVLRYDAGIHAMSALCD